jgi:hypothetical protein
MLITTLKLILRNWWQNKTFTLIALLSLTVGIACTNLLGAFVTYEWGIEKSNPNRKRMVWVMQDMPSNPGKKITYMHSATPAEVRFQVFGDMFLMVLISFLLSLLLMYDLLPVFNRIVSGEFTSSFFYSSAFFPFFVVFILILTVIPALVIGHRINLLSGSDFHLFLVNKKNHWIGVLVTAQFVIGVALITGMITANRQMDMVKQSGNRYRNLIEIGSMINETDLRPFKQKVESIPGVSDISLGNLPLMHTWIMHGSLRKENGEEFQTTVLRLSGDSGLFRILQLRRIVGSEWQTSSEKYAQAVFVNKTFADLIEKPAESLIGEPLQKYFDLSDSVSVIAGVMEDFYFNSLEEKAMMGVMEQLSSHTGKYTTMRIRLNGNDNGEVIKTIQRLWEQAYPDEYFTYTDVYRTFVKRNNKWIAFGFAIGIPLAWWLMERWLQQFAYRVDISMLSCLAALAIVTFVSVITVIWHTWRMARTNPVKSLRSE